MAPVHQDDSLPGPGEALKRHGCGTAKCENSAKCENAAKCEKQSTLNVKIPLNVKNLR